MANSVKKYAFVIDPRRCIDCRACLVACRAENNVPIPNTRIWVYDQGVVGEFPNLAQQFVPYNCMHCDEPPCVEACPTGASFKWEEDGIVDIDHDRCVGCRACMMACPYTNRYFNDQPPHYFPQGMTPYEEARTQRHQQNVVMKCNFCRDRVRAGKLPACVANCPTIARHFGDLDDPLSEVSVLIKERGGFTLHPEIGTGPSVYYLPP